MNAVDAGAENKGGLICLEGLIGESSPRRSKDVELETEEGFCFGESDTAKLNVPELFLGEGAEGGFP